MPDYDSQWENSGAFPSSKKSRPIITKSNGSDSEGDTEHIFSDEGFETTFDTLASVNQVTREATLTPHDNLMTMSHSSSETPAISNTTTTVVRNAIKKSKLGEGRSDKMYPYNMFRSIPEGKNEGEDNKDKSVKQQNGKGSTNPAGKPPRADPKRVREETPTRKSPPARITSLLTPVQDEPSSVITGDDHQHEQNQFIYDYMAEGADVEVMSARSRRHGGGSKHHMVRHTLPTSQKVTANPSNMLKNLFISIEEERHLHRLTAQHMRAIHNWFLFLPSILLSLLAGLVVLIFEADINFGDNARVYASISVGVLSLVSVFWQALCKQMDLGTKSALHNACSVALKRISEDILLTMSAAETIPAEYVALIGEKYGQAADACPLTIPYKLEAASAHLSDRMVLMLRPPMGQGSSHKQPKRIDLLRLYATAYDELSAEVINHFAFPFAIPDPRRVSETALRNFKSIIIEGKDKRRGHSFKSLLCPCFDTDDESTSLFDILAVVEGGHMTTKSYSQRSI